MDTREAARSDRDEESNLARSCRRMGREIRTADPVRRPPVSRSVAQGRLLGRPDESDDSSELARDDKREGMSWREFRLALLSREAQARPGFINCADFVVHPAVA